MRYTKRYMLHATRYKLKVQAFTLIELLLTIGVFSVLAGIGTAGFTSIRAYNQTDLVAAQIRSELLRVRSEALNDIDSGVYFESQRFVYFPGTSYVEEAVGNEETAIPNKLSLSTITFTDNTAIFDHIDGYLENYADPSHVVIQGQEGIHTVSVNEWGVIKIN